jgi:hypothetical protein
LLVVGDLDAGEVVVLAEALLANVQNVGRNELGRTGR